MGITTCGEFITAISIRQGLSNKLLRGVLDTTDLHGDT